MWAYVLVWPGNYLLKHSLSKKEPNELKLTVHTSGESLIKMNSDMSVRVKNWENIPSVRITISACTMGPSGGARQGAFKTLGPSGWTSLYLYSSPYLPSTLTHFPNGGWGVGFS
jgi:hypothetical protein